MITNVTLLINIYRLDDYNGYLCTQILQSLNVLDLRESEKQRRRLELNTDGYHRPSNNPEHRLPFLINMLCVSVK